MKKYKTMLITSIITLIPLYFVFSYYSKMPDDICVNFNQSDCAIWMNKNFALFIPIIILFISNILLNISIIKNRTDILFVKLSYQWFSPIISIIIMSFIIYYGVS